MPAVLNLEIKAPRPWARGKSPGRRRVALGGSGAWVTTFAPSQSLARRALVIGNAAYADSPLANPVNDATDLAALLRRLGFDVILRQNADKAAMEQAVEAFTQYAPRGSAGLFFLSGHGAEVEHENYLIPIGAVFHAESEVKYKAVGANWILGRMDIAGMDIKVVILEACRHNPLGRSWTRVLNKGLAVMDAPRGSAYATNPGNTASDGRLGERNSPFTAHLLRELVIPRRDSEVALKAVRAGVSQATNGKQSPWVHSSIIGDFYVVR